MPSDLLTEPTDNPMKDLHISIHHNTGPSQSHIKYEKSENINILFIKIDDNIYIINKQKILSKIDHKLKDAFHNFLLGCEQYFSYFTQSYNEYAIKLEPSKNNTGNAKSDLNYNKYLKYKNKYLQLKNLFNKIKL